MFGRLFSSREEKKDIQEERVLDVKEPMVTRPSVLEATRLFLSETGDKFNLLGTKKDVLSIKGELPEDYNIEVLLNTIINMGASELYLYSEASPYIRRHGIILKADLAPLSTDKCEELISQVCSEEEFEDLDVSGEIDFIYELKELSRFRISISKRNNGLGCHFKRIPFQIQTFQNLNLPPIMGRVALYKRGLVLITGPSKSGKSTTMASVIDYINEKKKSLIITIEDPVEFLHNNKKSIVIHREIGTNVFSYKEALQAIIKEDPDVVYIAGDLQDAETAELALRAAEMGSLVFSNLHLDSACKAIKRIVNFFPPERFQEIAARLSIALKAIICQHLIPKPEEEGSTLVPEILLNSKEISDLIRRGDLENINSLMSKSRKMGMQTMNDALIDMVEYKMISPEVAKYMGCSQTYGQKDPDKNINEAASTYY